MCKTLTNLLSEAPLHHSTGHLVSKGRLQCRPLVIRLHCPLGKCDALHLHARPSSCSHLRTSQGTKTLLNKESRSI